MAGAPGEAHAAVDDDQEHREHTAWAEGGENLTFSQRHEKVLVTILPVSAACFAVCLSHQAEKPRAATYSL